MSKTLNLGDTVKDILIKCQKHNSRAGAMFPQDSDAVNDLDDAFRKVINAMDFYSKHLDYFTVELTKIESETP